MRLKKETNNTAIDWPTKKETDWRVTKEGGKTVKTTKQCIILLRKVPSSAHIDGRAN
jgi:hypothetical protein